MKQKTLYICYPAGLDDRKKEHYYHDGIDAEVSLCERIAAWCGEEATVSTDAEKHEREILVGECERSETAQLLRELAPDEYAVVCRGEKTVVCGHCTASTLAAAEELLKTAPETLRDGYRSVGKCAGWVVDFPAFPFGKFAGMSDCFANRLQWYYEETEEADFSAYCRMLEDAGYALTYSNQIEKNRFARYAKGTVTLQVSYSANEGSTRVISAEETEWQSLPAGFGVRDLPEGTVTLTQMTLDYGGGSYGMCYVIRLPDSSFVLIDGGNVRIANGIPKSYDYYRLYVLLKEMNTRPDGKIVIDTWMMTHDHEDHFKVFLWFCRLCGEFRLPVEIRNYCATPCSRAMLFNSKNPGLHSLNGDLADAERSVGGFRKYLLHAGDRMEFGDLSFEFLYTVDDLFPQRLRYFNNSSFVARMRYREQQTLWLGDICEEPSALLRKRYSEKTLRSDLVQLAHHGLNGAEPELYEMIGAKVLFWSLSKQLIDQMLQEPPTLPHHTLGQHLVRESGITEYFTHSRSNYTLTLPYQTGESTLWKH